MSKFGKLDKKQVALALSLASVLGGSGASAMNSNKNWVKSSQSLGVATNNNSNLLASSKMLKKSKSMSTLAKVGIGVGVVLGAVELANEGAGIFTNADTWYKGKFSIANAAKHLFGGDNMKPEEKQALAGNILDVINTFDIQKIGELKLPKYTGNQLKNEAKEDYDKKYDEACVKAIKEIKDEQGNSYIDRVDVKRYELGGVISSGGVAHTFNKYKALRVFSFGGASHLGVLKDLQSWDFKNKYNKNDVKEITFAKNRIRIQYNCDEFSWFELQEDGKLKVCFNIGDHSGDKRLITEFTLEKPKK